MLAYRIEDSAGHGPYKARGGYVRRFPDHDKPLLPEAHHAHKLFGFASLADLAEWFDAPRRDWLEANGYHITQGETVGHVARGAGQIGFDYFKPCTTTRVHWGIFENV